MKKGDYKKPRAYIICGWVFGIAALILEAVALGLLLGKWNGYTWIMVFISSVGFVFLGITIAMVMCLNLDTEKEEPSEKKKEE